MLILILFYLIKLTCEGSILKRIFRKSTAIFLVVIITSCSFFVNTKEIEEKANVAFNDKKFDKFNTLYEKLEKADEEEAASYVNKIKKHNYFIINDLSTKDDLYTLELIKKQVPILSKLANKKIQVYTLLEISEKLDAIVTEGNQIGEYPLIIDTIEEAVEVENTLEDLVSAINKILTNLEDMNTSGEYKNFQENLIESVKDYRDKLHEKYMFFSENQTEVIVSNQLALGGNLYAATELVGYMEKSEQIQKGLEFSGETLQHRIEAISTKIAD